MEPLSKLAAGQLAEVLEDRHLYDAVPLSLFHFQRDGQKRMKCSETSRQENLFFPVFSPLILEQTVLSQGEDAPS